MSYMIHGIHTGEDASKPFILGSDDFSELLYPDDRRDCAACHVPSQYELPLPDGLRPMYLSRIDSSGTRVPDSDDFMPATAAACSGCHDSNDTLAHTEAMRTMGGVESCASCHGPGRTFDVAVVHASPGR